MTPCRVPFFHIAPCSLKHLQINTQTHMIRPKIRDISIDDSTTNSTIVYSTLQVAVHSRRLQFCLTVNIQDFTVSQPLSGGSFRTELLFRCGNLCCYGLPRTGFVTKTMTRMSQGVIDFEKWSELLFSQMHTRSETSKLNMQMYKSNYLKHIFSEVARESPSQACIQTEL